MTPTPLPPDAGKSSQPSEGPTPPASQPPSAAGLKPVHFVAVAAAVVGGALATLLLMDARPSAGTGPRPAAASAPSSVANPSLAINATAPVKWSSKGQARWVNPSRKAAAFEVPAERPVAVWNAAVTPVLVVRCTNGRVDTFVYTNSAARIEAEDENHSVKLVFDDEAGTHERWPDSIEHDALFAPDGRGLADRLSSAQAFRFTFAPHNAGPATAVFDVRGLKEKMAATKGCKAR